MISPLSLSSTSSLSVSNTLMGLFLVVKSINTLRTGDAILIRNILSIWCILVPLLVMEQLGGLANSLITRLLLLSIFLGDGTLAYWLVERSVAPRMDQAQHLVEEFMGRWMGPVKAGLLYVASFLVYQWNRLMGQLFSPKNTDICIVKK